MQQLRLTEVAATDNPGFTFTVPGETAPFLVITPCLNFRNKNFVVLFKDLESKSLELSSIYVAKDCEAIFDKQNRSEFFDEIRRKIRDGFPEVSLVTYATNGLNWATVGSRMQLSANATVLMEFEPTSAPISSESTQVALEYRGEPYIVTSRFFSDITPENCRLFAYQFIGNAYAKSKSDVY